MKVWFEWCIRLLAMGFLIFFCFFLDYYYRNYLSIDLSEEKVRDYHRGCHIIILLIFMIFKGYLEWEKWTSLSLRNNKNKLVFLDNKKYIIHWIKDKQCYYFMEKKKLGYAFAFSMSVPQNAFYHGEHCTTSISCHIPSLPVDHDNVMISLPLSEDDNTIKPFN